MKILVLLHGMPPQAGRTVVGAGLRAFANGEGLRAAGHDVHYCTRSEDLPEDLQELATARRRETTPGIDLLAGFKPAPGDPARKAARDAIEDTNTDPALQTVDTLRSSPHAGGLAPRGGPLGAPGNPWTFTEAHELHAVLRAVDPDVVLVEALEEARRLPEGRFSVILDMFAPRILEQQFQDAGDEREAVRVLDALQHGDHFVFSNERQKYYHLPLLALAGVDCTAESGAVVPISCPPELPAVSQPDVPTFVAGGVFWPWADITDGLLALLETLDAADDGLIHLYGGEYGIRSDTTRYADPRERLPEAHDRLVFKGMVPIDQLWAEYSRASVAFDLMAVNPEREINLSFRQIDYLRCGLPIITSPHQVIADDLIEYGAGWTVEPGDVAGLQALVGRLLANPEEIAQAADAAQRLAADKYVWTKSVAELEAIVANPRRRRHAETLVARMSRTQADLWEDHEENRRLREVLGHQHEDLDKKTEEVDRLNQRVQTLLGTVDRLTNSIGDVSKFKNEALNYLGESQDAAIREAGELGRELERKALDLHKKQEALERAHKEIDKLKGSIDELKRDHEALEAQYVSRDREVLNLEIAHKGLTDLAAKLTSDLSVSKREASRKEATIGELARNLNELEARFLEKLDHAESSARELISAAQQRAARAESSRGKFAEQVHHLEERVASLELDLVKKQEEIRDAELRRNRDIEELHSRLEDAIGRSAELLPERDELRGKLAEAEAEAASARADVTKKNRAIAAAERERERLEQQFIARLDRAEAEARALVEEARDRVATIGAERGKARARLDETEGRLRETERQLRGVHAELMERTRAAEESYAQWERDRRTIQEQADESIRLARQEADAARVERDQKHTELLETRAAADSALAEVGKKEEDLASAKLAHEALQDEMERRLAETWAKAKQVTNEQRTQAEIYRDRLGQADARVADLTADNRKKDEALAEAEHERERLTRVALDQLAASEQTARGLVEEARDRALIIDQQRGRLQAHTTQLEEELREANRNLAAKDGALAQAQADREAKVAAMELQNQEAWLHANRQIDAARGERDRVGDELVKAEARICDLERDLEKKDAVLGEASSERQRLETEYIRRLREAELAATERLNQYRAEVEARIGDLRTHYDQIESDSNERVSQMTLQSQEAWLHANRQINAARDERDRVADRLLRAEARIEDLDRDVDKKDAVIREAGIERQRLEDDYMRRLEEAEDEARARVTSFRDHYEARLAALRIHFERVETETAQRSEEEKLRITDEAEQRIHVARNAAEEARLQRDRAREEMTLVQALAEDLQSDVEKKTSAIEQAQLERDRLQEEFLANLERAEGSAQTLIGQARDRAAKLADERGKLQGFVSELEGRAQALSRELETRDAGLELAEQRLRAERGNFEEVLLELNRLRLRSSESDGRVAELEAELIRQQSALESLSGELARSTSQLESASFESDTLRSEVDKKSAELRQAQGHRDEAQRLLDEARERYEDEVALLRAEGGKQAARIEETEFELRTLRGEITKKSAELQEAQRQRDEAHAALAELAPVSTGKKKKPKKKRPEA